MLTHLRVLYYDFCQDCIGYQIGSRFDFGNAGDLEELRLLREAELRSVPGVSEVGLWQLFCLACHPRNLLKLYFLFGAGGTLISGTMYLILKLNGN